MEDDQTTEIYEEAETPQESECPVPLLHHINVGKSSLPPAASEPKIQAHDCSLVDSGGHVGAYPMWSHSRDFGFSWLKHS